MLQNVKQGTPLFLASVTDANEAEIALAGGADVIDAKNPSEGALGALSPAVISDIVATVARRVPVSATIGDLPSDATEMCLAARVVAAAGADVVKIGFFGRGPHTAAIRTLGSLDLGRARLAGVLMADQNPDLELIEAMARAGFAAVVLDTAGKSAGSLRTALGDKDLREFLSLARRHGLISGLAGSLSLADVAPLAKLSPGMLGFRGALCSGGRTSSVERARVAAVKAAMTAAVLVDQGQCRRDDVERSVA